MSTLLMKLLRQFTSQMPQTDYVFAYGSAAQPQIGYTYDDGLKSLPMVDLIISVNDVEQWHRDNLQINRGHYSGLGGILGAGFINQVCTGIFPIHFSPFIQFDDIMIKYGVVSSKTLLKDLDNWTWLSLAGRLQKPVLDVSINSNFDMERLQQSLRRNYLSAIAVCSLIDQNEMISEFQFLYNIMSLSYLGDIRFKLGGENQQKIANILKGNYQNIKDLYSNIIQTDETLSKVMKYDSYNENIIIQRDSKSRNTLIDLVPYGLMKSFSGTGKDTSMSIKMMQENIQKETLIEMIRQKNQFSSRRMLMAHLLTISPLLNAQYAVQKLSKRFKK